MDEKIKQNIERWKNRLLDLSLTNRSLNYKDLRASTISIIDPDIKTFLNTLVTRKKVEFARLFDDIDEDEDNKTSFNKTKKVKVFSEILPKKDVYETEELAKVISLYKQKYGKNFLFSNLNGTKQNNNLKKLMRDSNLFKEETAINVLFFATGFLKWYEDASSQTPRFAPITFVSAELTQRTVDSPFIANFLEEDIQLNDTLIRKLLVDRKLDISFDIDAHYESSFEKYQAYKKHIQEQISILRDKRWEVIDSIELSIFSFSKINMVNDLENNADKIAGNDFIKLLSNSYLDKLDLNLIREDQVDNLIRPDNFYHILNSDSSQEAAIQSAILGKSFVLEGPPGTGKSQTITNIITELVARGKKVLFVAEKKAALDVVYRNLQKIGMERFALPIHNSDLNKKEVLDDLASTLQMGGTRLEIENSYLQNQNLGFLRNKNELQEYFRKIDEPLGPLRLSLYEMYGEFEKRRNFKDLNFEILGFDNYSFDNLLDAQKSLENFKNSLKSLDFDAQQHPWFGIKTSSLKLKDKEQILSSISNLRDSIMALKTESNNFKLFSPKLTNFTVNILKYYQLLKHLIDYDDVSQDIAINNTLDLEVELLAKMSQLKNEYMVSANRIKLHYQEDVYKQINIEAFTNILKTTGGAFGRAFSGDYKRVKKTLKNLRNSKNITFEEINQDIRDMAQMQKFDTQIQNLKNQSNLQFDDTNLETINKKYKNAKWYKAFLELALFVNVKADYPYKIISAFNMNKIEYAFWIKKYENMIEIYKQNLNSVNELFDNRLVTFDSWDYKQILNKLNTILNSKSTLETYLEFNKDYDRLCELKLQDYANKIVEHKLKTNYYDIFLKRLYLLLIDKYIHQLLPDFSGGTLDVIRKNYQKAEHQIQESAKYLVKQKVIENIPNINSSLQGLNADVILLNKEAAKSRRKMPFRLLFQKIPKLITTLKPCLMMSPLSVSSYLKSSDLVFDCVIFDEASQVFPENAIGALFRAKQWIICGDKYQLPPTNFFHTNDEDSLDDDDLGSTDGFDSILDVAGAFLSNVRLRWHYRSKFEQLIEPSNNEIYNNLITFPSSTIPSDYQGIIYKYVKGEFIDQKNEQEADAVVNEIKKIFRKFGISKSVGVVTFNKKQQYLIEKRIYKLRTKDAKYEKFFSSDLKDPFFVKNIETVQGDERDIIIISSCYGSNKAGKISMNFGALNLESGYRRLNVAVTRAKECTILISSLHFSDIDKNKTQSKGVLFFQQYLEYAQNATKVNEALALSNAALKNPFEDAVFEQLVKAGYKVIKKVGCSGYKIDLAILNPKNENEFILGIECDGSIYQNSKSARDRDVLRQEVLESRGWNIYRIWSTDWIKNSEKQLKAIDLKIKEILKKPNSEIKKPVVQDSKDTKNTQKTTIPVKETKKESIEIFKEFPDIEKAFQQAQLSSANVSQKMINFIDTLSPVHEKTIKKYLTQFVSKNTLNDTSRRLIKSGLRFFIVNKDLTWDKNGFFVVNEKPIKFRKNNSSDKRPVAEVHPEEVKDAFIQIVSKVYEIDKDILYKTFIHYLNYQSLSAQSREYLDTILKQLIKKNILKIDKDNVVTKY